jgi:hypothetical protein
MEKHLLDCGASTTLAHLLSRSLLGGLYARFSRPRRPYRGAAAGVPALLPWRLTDDVTSASGELYLGLLYRAENHTDKSGFMVLSTTLHSARYFSM